MVYKSMIRLFDERKRRLESLMGDESLHLSHERYHQIKGAVDEIDLFLQTLRQHQDQRVHRNFCYTPELQTQNKGFISRLFGTKDKGFAMHEAIR